MKLPARNENSVVSSSLAAAGTRLAIGVLLAALAAACAPLQIWKPQSEPLLISGSGRAPDLMSLAKKTAEGEGGASASVKSVSGWSKIKQGLFGASGGERPKWSTETVEVRAAAPIASDATSHVEAFLVARRLALEDAFRKIAERVAELPLEPDGTVGSLLETDPVFRDRLEKTIRAESKVQLERQKRKDLYGMVARLDLAVVADRLPGAAGGTAGASAGGAASEAGLRRLGRGVELPGDPVRLAAFEEAERDARMKLFERVREERLYPNLTIGNLMAIDPEATMVVIGAIHEAPVVKAGYPAPDACELVLSLDIESLSGRLRKK